MDKPCMTIIRMYETFGGSGKSAYRTAGNWAIDSETIIIVVKESHPVFGIEHKFGRPMSVSRAFADYLGQLAATFGMLANVRDDSVKFAVGIDRRKLLTASGVLGLIGAMIIEPCGDVDRFAFKGVPKLKITLARHVVQCPLHSSDEAADH